MGVLEGPANFMHTTVRGLGKHNYTRHSRIYNLVDGKINKDYNILEKANHYNIHSGGFPFAPAFNRK
jgi:hypothetical protein